MRIIGFNLTKILVEREEKDKTGIRVDQSIDIADIIEENLPITQDKALKIKFSLKLNYSENFAKLEFEGNILALPNEEEFKAIIDSWKDKNIPEGIKTGVFNFIMNKCNVKALNLEDELGLPLHVPMPRLSKEPKKKEE